MTDRPLVVSHRTNMGTQPENTLAGIGSAVADGVDGVEIDLRATSDGLVVLMHDGTLQRTAGDPRSVTDLPAAELASLRLRSETGGEAGAPPPSLPEALRCVDGRTILVIEVKQPAIERTVAEAVRAAEAASWCWVWAFDPAVVSALREALPQVPALLLVSPRSHKRFGFDSYVDLAVNRGVAGVSLAHSMIDRATLAAAQRRGLAGYTWTVDDRDDIARVRDAGVDAICGNFPRRIIAALA